MRTTSPGNPPYVWSKLSSATDRTTCTALFLELGLAEGASLVFDIPVVGELHLREIANRGRWRDGGSPKQRGRREFPVRDPRRELRAPRPSSFPFDDRDAILKLAERYWGLITAGEVAEERAFEADLPQAREAGFLSKDLFVRLARWKSVRKTPDYESNSEEDIAASTRAAFSATTEAEAIAALTQLNGVAQRTATALLHWMAPDRQPILDFRVVAALGELEPRERDWNDPAYYARIAARVRELAGAHGLDLRTVDRALWAWDKLGGETE